MVEEAESDMRWESTEQILRDLLDSDLYDLLDHRDRLQELREEIQDRDDSDMITELQKVSPHSLFRYDLDVEVPDYTMSAQERADSCTEIIRAAGLEGDQRTVEEIYGLIDDASYGGGLYVLWSAHPDDAITLAEPVGWDEHGKELTEPCGTVTFTQAHLLILDKWNGSGHEIELPTITAEWGPRRVVIDSPRVGNGYSWTDIAGPVRSAYQATYTLDRPDLSGRPAWTPSDGHRRSPVLLRALRTRPRPPSAAGGVDLHDTVDAVPAALPTTDIAVGPDAGCGRGTGGVDVRLRPTRRLPDRAGQPNPPPPPSSHQSPWHTQETERVNAMSDRTVTVSLPALVFESQRRQCAADRPSGLSHEQHTVTAI